jgi:hypothetical protein
LSGIGAGVRGSGASCREDHVLADEGLEQTLHVAHDGVDIDDFQFQQLLAAEGQKLASKSGGAVGSQLNRLALLAQRMIEIKALEDDFGISADHHEQIVEVVGDSAGQTANGFHFLGLAELVFKHAAVGDILGNGL